MTALGSDGFGPVPFEASPDAIAYFVAATGDDHERWTDAAPPSMAAAALIAVAGPLLQEAIQQFPAVVHTRQRFDWATPLAAGSALGVTGEVTSQKERAGTTLVEFMATAGDWMTSTSSFLMASDIAIDASEIEEPPPEERADTEVPSAQGAPTAGDPMAPLHKSASRLDIARYAAASGDWNPIHWDHQSATAAGLGGVVAHGLLAASWMCQAAARYSASPQPLSSIDLRFRKPLRPAVAAIAVGVASGVAPLAFDMTLEAGGEALVTASAEVNE